jgi:hypothetical protein
MPAAWLQPRSGGDWGARSVVEHLLDVEGIAFRERMQRIVDQDDPAVRSIDPAARLAGSGLAQRSVPELLDDLARRRAADLAWVRSLTVRDLDRTAVHDVAGTISVRELVHYWATHDLVHLSQLLAALRERLVPLIGGMVRFLED